MKKLILFLSLVLIPTLAIAGNWLYLGKYFGDQYASDPDNQTGADWKAVIHLEIPTPLDNYATFWTEAETRIDRSFGDGYVFHPSSVEYSLGVIIPIWQGLSLEAEHMCWHHIDSDGTNQQYNLVGLRYEW